MERDLRGARAMRPALTTITAVLDANSYQIIFRVVITRQ